MHRIKLFSRWRALCIIAGSLVAAAAHGQVVSSAQGRGASFWAGAEYSNFRAGFPSGSDTRLSGLGLLGNYNWNHRFGVDAHIRFLNFNSWNGETQQDYLAGPRYTFLHDDKFRPFAAFQVGLVKIQYPFNMGSGTSFAMAPSGGVEYRINRKWSVRAAYEFQLLTNSPNFTDEPAFGIKPNGASVGMSYRIF